MRFIRGLSADMDDLTTDKGRREAEEFLAHVEWCIRENVCEPAPVQLPAAALVSAMVPEAVPAKDGDVVIWEENPLTTIGGAAKITIVDGKIVHQK